MKPRTRMALVAILMGSAILAGLAGCDQNAAQPPDERTVNTRLMNSYNDAAVQNAIISEHTLYAHHFVQDAPALNEIGERDLAVLTRHLARNGGSLNIRRQDASAELYQARINTVRQKLQEAGIEAQRVQISEGMPGGSGMPSENVLVILKSKGISAPTGTSTTLTSGVK